MNMPFHKFLLNVAIAGVWSLAIRYFLADPMFATIFLLLVITLTISDQINYLAKDLKKP